MAKTAAQRQAAYRNKRPEAGDNGDRRLSSWASTAAFLALRRIAKHHGTTRRAMLEQLIIEADNQIEQSLRSNDDEWNRYIEG